MALPGQSCGSFVMFYSAPLRARSLSVVWINVGGLQSLLCLGVLAVVLMTKRMLLGNEAVGNPSHRLQ